MILDGLVYISECIALLSAWRFHRLKPSSRSKVLLVLLLVIVLVETITYFTLVCEHVLVMINLVIFIELTMYFVLFTVLLRAGQRRRWVVILWLLYLVSWFVVTIYFQPLDTHLQSFSYIIGASGILVSIICYLYQELILMSDASPVYGRYFIWISAGLFVFLATEIPIMGIVNYMVVHDIDLSEMPIFNLRSVITILYYLTYPIGLIWMRTE